MLGLTAVELRLCIVTADGKGDIQFAVRFAWPLKIKESGNAFDHRHHLLAIYSAP